MLLYHLVFPVKYRRKVFTIEVDEILRQVYLDISDRYEIDFIEIGTDIEHVQFLLLSVPTLTVIKIVTTIKSITAREIFSQDKYLKRELWGGDLWTSGYYANTVGMYVSQEVIKRSIQDQGKEAEYIKSHEGQ